MLDIDVDPAVTILTAAATVHGHYAGALTRDHRLDALGFDSLDRIALVIAIEHTTHRPVPDHVLASAGSLGDLIDHLAAYQEGSA